MAKITDAAGPSNAALDEPIGGQLATGEPVIIDNVESTAAPEPPPEAAPVITELPEGAEGHEIADLPQRQTDPVVTEPADTAPAGDVEPAAEDQVEDSAEASPGAEPEEVEGEVSAGTEAPPRPADSANKSEWVAYVAAVTGDDPAEISAAYTKAELIEAYG